MLKYEPFPKNRLIRNLSRDSCVGDTFYETKKRIFEEFGEVKEMQYFLMSKPLIFTKANRVAKSKLVSKI